MTGPYPPADASGPKATEATDGDGQSQGGAYPNPHSGTSDVSPEQAKEVRRGWGGENGAGYHGGGTAGGTYPGEEEEKDRAS